MNHNARLIPTSTFCLVIGPCLLHYMRINGLVAVKPAALTGTDGWFTATPIWMSRESSVDAGVVEI